MGKLKKLMERRLREGWGWLPVEEKDGKWKESINCQRLFSPASIKVKETEDQKEERTYPRFGYQCREWI